MISHAEIERELLRAMQLHYDPVFRTKCDCILRQALQALNRYDPATSEYALCNSGDEDANVWQSYDVLRQLIQRGLADGAGDLRLPAGPRYTECRIATAGRQRLNLLLDLPHTPDSNALG